MANESPIASTARTVRAVNLESRGTERWRIEADGAHACDVDIAIDLAWHSRVTYRIFTPDIPAGYLSPRLMHSGTFDRGSQWWTPEVLRSVLGAIVRSIAPAAVEVTIASADDATTGPRR